MTFAVKRRMKNTISLALLVAATLAFLLHETTLGGQTAARRPRRANALTPPPQPTPPAQQPTRVPQLPATTPKPNATPSQTPAPSIPSPTPASSPAPADEAAIDDDEVIRVNSNLVVVPVSVTNEQGEAVQGLQAADFRLTEEGRAQVIAQLGDAEQVPLDIVVLFDVSSSVTSKSFFEFQQQAAVRFLKQVLKPTDRAAIFAFGQQANLVQGLAAADVAAAKVLTIPAATISTGTAFYDGVAAAAKYLAQNAPARHRRVLLVISDGEDNFSDRTREASVADYEAQMKETPAQVRVAARRRQEGLHRQAITDVQREVQGADVVFYSINPSGSAIRLNEISTRAQSNMKQIADATGGNSFVPERLENLDAVFRQIANELRAQYLLQYYSNSDAPAGQFLNIKVAVPTRSGTRVRARQGYYVKK